MTYGYEQDEVNRLGLAHSDMFMHGPRLGHRPAYAELELSGPGTGETLQISDVEGARYELAARNPLLDPADIEAAVIALSGGERDSDSQARAIVELAQMSPGQMQQFVISLASSDISQAERRQAADQGHALPDGSYPIRNVRELHSAATLAASGHGDVKAARKLIRKMAAHFGVDVSTLPGFGKATGDGDADDDSAAMSAQDMGNGYVSIGLTGGQDYRPAEETDPVAYYVGLAAASSIKIHDAGSTSDGESPDHEAEVRRYLAMVNDKPYGANKSYPARSAAARDRAESRELAGGRPQGRI